MQDILYALDVGSEGGAMDLQPMSSGACTPRRSESLGLQVMPLSHSRGNDWDGRRLDVDVSLPLTTFYTRCSCAISLC